MADAATPAKKRKSFTRTAKPLYGVLKIADGNGGYINITKEQVELTVERDSAKLLAAVMGGSVTGVLVEIKLPAAPARAAS
jgi:hypothetical protein